MKRTFDFGKIDYSGTGRKINRVTVSVELKTNKDGLPEFSASGAVRNGRGTDLVNGGQNLDELNKLITDPTFKTIYAMWQKYHLNGMHAECEHQRELGWLETACKQIVFVNKYGRTETKLAGWVYETEHSDGILCKPCPVCGYEYGTSWLYMPIDGADLLKIESLFNGQE